MAVPCRFDSNHARLMTLESIGKAAGAVKLLTNSMDDGTEVYQLEEEVFALIHSLAGEDSPSEEERAFILPMIGEDLAELHPETDRSGLKDMLTQIAEVASALAGYVQDEDQVGT